MLYPNSRRSGRISRQVPITLIGSDATGRVFTEETHTVVLSLHGAGIVSRNKLIAEQELTLRSLDSGRETEIRVVGEIGSEESLHTYGVAFHDEHLDFWKIEFPPAPEQQQDQELLVLECTGCHTPLTLENSEYEFDVCTIHGGLVRYCDQCAFATMWKLAPAGAETKAPSFLPSKPAHLLEAAEVHNPVAVMERPPGLDGKRTETVLESLSETTTSLPADRRSHGRAKVNYSACVRSEAFGDDIVICIDMSRGGLAFKTKYTYLLSTVVSVAVPFSREYPEAPAIFMAAKIVSLTLIPGTELYRCAAAFLRGDA